MNKILEKLWNEHYAEECATLQTKEEKALIKKTAELREALDDLLTKEQIAAIEKYIELLYEIQGFFTKKAFLTGCKFAASFFLEIANFEHS